MGRHPHPPRLATALLVLLLALTATPTAAADDTYNVQIDSSRCEDDEGGLKPTCLLAAILAGLAALGDSIFGGLASVLKAITVGLANFVLIPFLGLFGAFFTGLGQSAQALAAGIFGGAADAFNASYAALEATAAWTGPLAPLIATAVVSGVGLILAWVAWNGFTLAANVLPRPLERVLEDQSEDEPGDG